VNVALAKNFNATGWYEQMKSLRWFWLLWFTVLCARRKRFDWSAAYLAVNDVVVVVVYSGYLGHYYIITLPFLVVFRQLVVVAVQVVAWHLAVLIVVVVVDIE
jgi:hypothetical protein